MVVLVVFIILLVVLVVVVLLLSCEGGSRVMFAGDRPVIVFEGRVRGG